MIFLSIIINVKTRQFHFEIQISLLRAGIFLTYEEDKLTFQLQGVTGSSIWTLISQFVQTCIWITGLRSCSLQSTVYTLLYLCCDLDQRMSFHLQERGESNYPNREDMQARNAFQRAAVLIWMWSNSAPPPP